MILFTYTICGEYLVERFSHAFMSSNFYSSIKQFSQEMLPNLVEKMKQQNIFDIWMSKGTHYVFNFVINFLGIDQNPKHVTITLFEAIDSTKQ